MTLTFEKVNDLYNIYIYVDGQYVNVLSNVDFGEVQKVSFMGNTTGLTFRGKVTSIIINKNNYISEEKMNEYINELTSIYNNNSEYPKMFQSSMALNDMEYDYFSLNKSLTSFKGVKPKTFISNNVIEKLEDNFEYDKDIDGIGYGRYVYAVKNQKLEYDLSLSKSGSIGFRYKAVKDEATILASLKDIASNFSVFILSLDDGALYFKIGGYTETTDPLLYEWNNVIVTWSRMIQSSSLDDLVYNLKIFVNGGLIINKEIIMNKEAENVILTIGDSLYNEVGSSKTYAYIEKLFYTKQGDIVGGNIHNILTYYPLKVNTYDNLYRMNESIIKTSANTVLKKTYDYKKREKVVGEEDSQVTLELETNQILGEVFSINDVLEYASNVSYDDYGRVVKIRKYVPKEGEESPNIGQIGSGILILDKYDVTETNYEYDSLGQLKSTNQNGNETFSYDSYGNLITVVKDGVLTKSIGYEGIKLKTYNGKLYEYEGLYITKEKEGEEVIKEYKWEGNKLVEVIDHKNKKKYKYIYSVLGLRTSKTIYSIEDEEEKIIEESVYNYNSKQLLVSEARVFVKDGLYSAEFIINYMYDAKDEMYGFSYNGVEYYFERDIQGNIARIYNNYGTVNAVYKYDAFGEHMVYTKGGSILNSESFIGNINRIRYKGYYYDKETGLAMVGQRYYSPELCRFIQPADVSTLNPSSINGLNLYSYANNNPIGIAYSSSSAGFDSNGGMVSSIGNAFGSIGNSISGSSSRIPLPTVPWLVENATTMYGTASSLISGTPILAHYFKYASIINDEFKLYGISKWKTSLQLSNVNLKMGALDGALIGVNVLIDMYDSYQRGVSTEGILLGGALTAASGVGMFYLNKGIMWSTTTIGTAICPGIGTAIGFTVGLVGSILVDIFLGGWIADWIDNNVK